MYSDKYLAIESIRTNKKYEKIEIEIKNNFFDKLI